MKTKRFLSVFVTLSVIISYTLSVSTFATDSLAYKKLLAQEPVHIADVTLDSLGDFYASRTTDQILDINENNYINDTVLVGGKQVMCHVYMRTFNISDISSVTKSEAEAKSKAFLSQVKDAVRSKYIKCVVRNYSITVSVKEDKQKDIFTQMTVHLMLALGESNEQRNAVIQTFVKPNADLWSELSTTDKFIALNSFILNGQFSYDTEYKNRSSVYEFIAGKKGVCEEYAGLTSLFLDYMGFENILITGTVKDVGHMWNMVRINGRIYHLDILWNGPIDATGTHVSVGDGYLLKSTATVASTHTSDTFFDSYTSAAVYDYYFGPVPEHISSELYTVTDTGFINIPAQTTFETFKSSIEHSEFITVKKGNIIISDTDFIGTDFSVELSVNGVPIHSLTAAVRGDATGDGHVNTDDLEVVEEYVLEKRLQTRNINVWNYVCDINSDGSINVCDLFVFNGLTEPPFIPDSSDTESSAPDTETSDTSDGNTGEGTSDTSADSEVSS